jgi:hypothetical protein
VFIAKTVTYCLLFTCARTLEFVSPIAFLEHQRTPLECANSLPRRVASKLFESRATIAFLSALYVQAT